MGGASNASHQSTQTTGPFPGRAASRLICSWLNVTARVSCKWEARRERHIMLVWVRDVAIGRCPRGEGRVCGGLMVDEKRTRINWVVKRPGLSC